MKPINPLWYLAAFVLALSSLMIGTAVAASAWNAVRDVTITSTSIPADAAGKSLAVFTDIVQDDLLGSYFTFGTAAMDWRAHILRVADYWNHVLLFAPGYEIDIIDRHREIHEHGVPFSSAAFDQWLQIFLDAVDGGWTGPIADIAKKRATGMAWAMAQRVLGKGVWRPSVQ